LRYWSQKLADLGSDEVSRRLVTTPAAQAYRQTGQPVPFVQSANDYAGAEAYYQYLASQGLAPADKAGFIAGLLGNFAEYGGG
jgi:hypothetical protein